MRDGNLQSHWPKKYNRLIKSIHSTITSAFEFVIVVVVYRVL